MIIEHIKSMLSSKKSKTDEEIIRKKPIRQLKKQRSQERMRRSSISSSSENINSSYLSSPTKKSLSYEIIPNRLSIFLQKGGGSGGGGGLEKRGENIKYFTIKDWFCYPDLTEYYGPSNIAHIVRFNQLLVEHFNLSKNELCLFLDRKDKQSLNGLLLVGSFLLLEMGMDILEVEMMLQKPFQEIITKTYKTEGSYSADDLPITVKDCLRGIIAFRNMNLLPPINSLCPQTILEMERVENGDMNWIVPGKILAFAGPRSDFFSVEKFIDWALLNNVRGIIRLNKGGYKAGDMKERGLEHYQMFIPDGHVPSQKDIDRFIGIAEMHWRKGEAIGVHCHAGLGRTATMIALFLIKKYNFNADYVIAILRMMRPGSVLSYQARFLECMQYSLRGEETPVECQEWLDLLLN